MSSIAPDSQAPTMALPQVQDVQRPGAPLQQLMKLRRLPWANKEHAEH